MLFILHFKQMYWNTPPLNFLSSIRDYWLCGFSPWGIKTTYENTWNGFFFFSALVKAAGQSYIKGDEKSHFETRSTSSPIPGWSKYYKMCKITLSLVSSSTFSMMSDLWEKAIFSPPRSSFGILRRHCCLLKRLVCTHHTGVGKLFHVVEALDESRQNVALCFQTFEGAVTVDHGESAAVTSLLLRKSKEKKSVWTIKMKKRNQWGWTSTARRPVVSLGRTCLASSHHSWRWTDIAKPQLFYTVLTLCTQVKVQILLLLGFFFVLTAAQLHFFTHRWRVGNIVVCCQS